MSARATLMRLLEPLALRIAGLVLRGRVTAVDDSKKMQTLQVALRARQVLGGVEHFQPYGLSAVPPLDAEVLALALSGNAEHTAVVAVDDRASRPTGQASGEVSLYSKFGQRVKLLADGSVEISSSTAVRLVVGSNSIELSSTGVVITTPGGTAEYS